MCWWDGERGRARGCMRGMAMAMYTHIRIAHANKISVSHMSNKVLCFVLHQPSTIHPSSGSSSVKQRAAALELLESSSSVGAAVVESPSSAGAAGAGATGTRCRIICWSCSTNSRVLWIIWSCCGVNSRIIWAVKHTSTLSGHSGNYN